MRLISFDVGIKNMAYCIFCYQDSSLTIENWNIMNLMNEETKPEYKCHFLLKNKKVCNKEGQYQKDNQCYCKKHAEEQNEYLIPSKENSVPTINKMKIQELREFVKKLKLDNNQYENIDTLLRPRLLFIVQEHLLNHTLVKIERKKTKTQDMDLIQIGKNMTKILNEIPGIEIITHIIIENQISPIASRMKTIQGMLAQYFILKCPPTSTIEFISSANKLKGLVDSSTTTAASYKDNKNNAIVICSKIIETNPCFTQWSNILKTHKKKDDLYDACLQGLWYLKNKNIIRLNPQLELSFVSTLPG